MTSYLGRIVRLILVIAVKRAVKFELNRRNDVIGKRKKTVLIKSWILAVTLGVFGSASQAEQQLIERQELQRADFASAPGMEIISSVTTFHPGAVLRRHIHHGVESGYVLEGAQVEEPGKPIKTFSKGLSVLFLRDIPHGGFTIVGEKPLKLFTVHIVDKGKPLYEWLDNTK